MNLAAILIGGVFLLAGGVPLVISWFIWPEQASHAYLFGYTCSFTVVIGSLFLLMIGHASNAGWFVPIRRSCEAAVGTLPLLAALFVPVLVFMPQLYSWTQPETLGRVAREHVEGKQALLNVPFFVARALACWAVFLLLGELLRYFSLRQDHADPARERRRMVKLSAGGLPLLALALTMAAFDWFMSLDPAWYSDIYGVYVFAGGFVSALGLFGALTVINAPKGPASAHVRQQYYHAIGRLELAMVIFWTYIFWVQLMLMWVADLPLETRFYRTRMSNGWLWYGLVLIVVHWAIPFFCLLFRPLKKNPKTFFAVSVWLLMVHVLDIYFLIVPAFDPFMRDSGWLELCALFAVAGACFAFGALRTRTRALCPTRDPLFEQGLEYEPQ